MAAFFNQFFGVKSASSPIPSAEDGAFADFAGAPEPAPASISPVTASTFGAPPTGATLPYKPYTKWYRVWERSSLSDFKQEAYILPLLILVVLVNFWGTRANRRKAKAWITAHAPILQSEFAVVGYGGGKASSSDDVAAARLLQASQGSDIDIPEELLRENASNEYTTYATGRQNAAFVDIKLSLLKRYNPFGLASEAVLGLFLDSMPAPTERMEASIYTFDGKESELVPGSGGKADHDASQQRKPGNSTYDGFVWAIAHKDKMNQLRTDRYDISLTTTKDSPKLPNWVTVMSESAEITDTLLTPELAHIVEQAGEGLEALIITDQPIDQPKKLNEAIPKKRISLAYRLASNDTYDMLLPLFAYFLRLPDILVSTAHFRPEVMRRVRQTREDEIRKIKRVDEEEKEVERRSMSDKQKKEKRDALLGNLSASEQRKFLEKEREKDLKRSQKRKTIKG